MRSAINHDWKKLTPLQVLTQEKVGNETEKLASAFSNFH